MRFSVAAVRGSILLALAAVLFGNANSSARAADKADEKTSPSGTKLPLLLDEDFAKGADRWAPAWPDSWKIIDIDGGKAFSEYKGVELMPPYRSPWNIALLKEVELGDFVMEVKLRETHEEYPHRDSVLVLGYQGPAKFYYVHFAPEVGTPTADQIFIVNDANRKKITDNDHLSPGIHWGGQDQWHKLRIVRNVSDGLIEAYYDDMEKPVMVAHDKTFTWGRVGIGTFDDTADFASVKLWGDKVKPTAAEAGDTSQPPYPGVKKKEPAPAKDAKDSKDAKAAKDSKDVKDAASK